MGRKTWESLPEHVQPLPGRLNIILSHSWGSTRGGLGQEGALNKGAGGSTPVPQERGPARGAYLAGTLSEALALVHSPPWSHSVETCFVIGGGQVYREAMSRADCAAVHLTSIEEEYKCDTFFPDIDLTRFQLYSASSAKQDLGLPLPPQTSPESNVVFTIPVVSTVDLVRSVDPDGPRGWRGPPRGHRAPHSRGGWGW
eukprot:gene9611-7526_t